MSPIPSSSTCCLYDTADVNRSSASTECEYPSFRGRYLDGDVDTDILPLDVSIYLYPDCVLALGLNEAAQAMNRGRRR